MRAFWLGGLAVVAWAHGDTIPTPREFLGFDVCQDYHLANYRQLAAYWQELDRRSDRLSVESIGKTEDGRDQLMCIVTDPSNRRNLESYRRASERLARAKDFKNDAEAKAFASKQKAVVWIDGGLHATETLVGQHLIEMAYRLVTAQDAETRRILRDCIVLLVHANPDGQDWVADHYMRRADPSSRSLAGLPFLYQKYCGHDNNRDFYANNMAETRNINRVLYSVWYPQVVYNHHQSAPAGTIMFAPPFRNPFNYHMDPITAIGTDLVGTHMHQRMIAEGKKGTAMRGSTLYSTWWNGGLRTTTYFHNMIGILTETWGSPNPAPLPFVQRFQVPTTDVPFPVDAGTMWHLRDSLEYEVSANYAILDYASRFREKLLFDFYRAGRSQIEAGSKDTWPRYPARIAAQGADALKRPENRTPRMFVIPRDQPDFPTASLFAEKLQQCGVEVEELVSEATLPGSLNGDGIKLSPGSIVVRCAQAFRPHVLDMFEPQDHPNDFQYAGGPPIPPYDNAGYTLAFQMGVQFVRVLDPVELPTRPFVPSAFTWGRARMTKHVNLAYRDANRALKGGTPVTDGDYFEVLSAGAGNARSDVLSRRPKVGLWDRYGGSMESGWTRYVLEQFDFDFDLVFPPDFEFGALSGVYDCIVLPAGAIPSIRNTADPATGPGGEAGGEDASLVLLAQGQGQGQGQGAAVAQDTTIPYVYRRRIGTMGSKAVSELRKYVEAGGHVFAIGSSALNLAKQLSLPVESALVDERGAPLPTSKFYVPGSVLRMKVNAHSLSAGSSEYVDVMFDNSPAFRVPADPSGAEVVSLFDSDKPLRSGWAWGQESLKGAAAIVDVPLGKGRIVLCGPEILFRAQSHGAFRFLFNAIFRAGRGR